MHRKARSKNKVMILWVKPAVCLILFNCVYSQAVPVINVPGYTDRYLADLSGNYSYGNLAVYNGDVYMSGRNENTIKKITNSGQVTDFVTLPVSDGAQCMAFSGNFLFASSQYGKIYEFDLSVPSPTGVFVAELPGASNAAAEDMAIAPASFGELSGQIIVSGWKGIHVINPITQDVSYLVGDGSTTYNYNSMCLTTDGNLYAIHDLTDQIHQIHPDGSVTTFASGIGWDADGIAIHPITGNMYIACSSDNTLKELDVKTMTWSIFASDIDFDNGFYPSPLCFSSDGYTLFYGIGENSCQIRAIDGFVPEPTTICLIGLGSLSLLRKRKK
jgi:WD40 repeat protein